jgi:hypothetical protein
MEWENTSPPARVCKRGGWGSAQAVVVIVIIIITFIFTILQKHVPASPNDHLASFGSFLFVPPIQTLLVLSNIDKT